MSKNIQKYNDFINESLLLEAYMIYNNDFKDILDKIDTPISRKIQSLGKTDVNVNTNYISIDDEREDYILFTADDKVQKLNPIVRSAYNSYHSLSIYANENGYPINNIAIPYTGQEVEELKVLDDNDMSKLYTDNFSASHVPNGKISHIRFIRIDGKSYEILYPTSDLIRNYKNIKSNPYKVGRFVTNILTKAGVEFSTKDVEDFVSKFKSQVLKKRNILDNFEIVTDEDIRKYYSDDNYSFPNSGTLGSSCMRYDKCQSYFDIYVKNASLIIFRDPDSDEDKIIGRALLWDAIQNSTKDDIKFMDRIYINDHSHTELFKEFAIKNKFFYKVNQDYNNVPLMFNGTTLSKEDSLITVHLEKGIEYDKFPFIDTVCFYNVDDDTLTNDSNSSYDFELTTTNGRAAYCEYCEDGVRYCEDCNGDGEVECGNCEGEGEVECGNCEGEGGDEDCSCNNGSVDCEECDEGKIECENCVGDGTYTCPYCNE